MKLDLHCHSSASLDADASWEEIIHRCCLFGIGAIAIADHDTVPRPSMPMIVEKEGASLYVIPSMELTTREGIHIVALGVSAPLPSHQSALTVIDAIHVQGAIAVIAHPYRYGSGLMNSGLTEAVRTGIIDRADAIEVLNGKSSNAERSRNRQFADQYPMKGRSVGSDAHYPYEIGRVYLETDTEVRDIASLRRALTDQSYRFVALPRNERKEQWYRRVENHLAWWAQWLHPFPKIHRKAKELLWPALKYIRTLFY